MRQQLRAGLRKEWTDSGYIFKMVQSVENPDKRAWIDPVNEVIFVSGISRMVVPNLLMLSLGAGSESLTGITAAAKLVPPPLASHQLLMSSSVFRSTLMLSTLIERKHPLRKSRCFLVHLL